MKLLLCTPGNNFSDKHVKSLIQFLAECWQNDIDVQYCNAYNSVVSFARNSCIGGDIRNGRNQKPFNGKLDYDYMLWIDSDIVKFSFSHFIALHESNKDIISGLYKINDSCYAVSKRFDKKFMARNGHYPFVTTSDLGHSLRLFKADGVGLGFCLVKRGVFESIEYPWFEQSYIDYGIIHDQLSEDFTWCDKVRAAGFEIWIDPTIKVKHLKSREI